MRKELRERIACKAEDGSIITVNRYVTVITHTPISGRTTSMDGTSEYRTSDGQHVNLNKDGTFTIVLTDEVLTRAG